MSATTAPASAPEELAGEEIEQEEIKQKETGETKTAEEKTLTPALSQEEREKNGHTQLAERVRQSERLPAGLRARIAELLEAASTPEGFEAAVRAVEDALPGGLRIASQELRRPEHPLGNAFFSGGKPGELTDDEAERIAKEQLARAGLLRGQRVRVGD